MAATRRGPSQPRAAPGSGAALPVGSRCFHLVRVRIRLQCVCHSPDRRLYYVEQHHSKASIMATSVLSKERNLLAVIGDEVRANAA